MAPYSYEQQRVHYPNGAWADASVVRFPAEALRFEDIILYNHYARRRDAARLRYYKARVRGETDPVIVAWACLENDRPVAQVFPGLETTTDDGEHLLSVNSLITYTLRVLLARGWLRREQGTWSATVPAAEARWRERAKAVLRWLQNEARLGLEVGPGRAPPSNLEFGAFNPALNLIPVGRCGCVRDAVREHLPRAAFNAAYFLLEHDDFISHHSALGDPYGLMVQDGVITRPPLYRRGVIWRAGDGRWQLGPIGMNDVKLALEDGTTFSPQDRASGGLVFRVNPGEVTEDFALYTRYHGIETHGRVLGYTPVVEGQVEFTIIDRRVVGWKAGGGLLIPQNGFVFSIPSGDAVEALKQAFLNSKQVTYILARPEHQGIQRALQCGPILIRDGHLTLTPATLADEEYWISRETEAGYVVGVVPSDYPDDIDQSRAARIGLGIDANGDLMVVAISGTSKGLAVPGQDSMGATLVELAGQLLAAGAVEAINLDGGGSVQLFVEGGLFNRPGDQRGHRGVIYERMVPSIGLVP